MGGFGFRGVETFFADDGQTALKHLSVGGSHFHATDIRGDHDKIRNLLFFKVAVEDGGTEKMIDRNIEKTLDLLGMEIHGQNSVHARRYQQVRDELCGDGYTGLVFAVLAGIAVKRKDSGDTESTGATGGIDEDEKLHEVLIRGRAGGLNNKEIIAANILFEFHEGLAVGKGRYGGLS